MRRLTTKVNAMFAISLALAAYAPKAVAQIAPDPATTAKAAQAAAWVICDTPAGPVIVLGTCAFAAGACVGYGIYKGIEWCFPDPPIGPSVYPPVPAPGPTVGPAPGPTVGPQPGPGLPPPPPITKEGCIVQHSLCSEDSEEAWEMAYKMCLDFYPDEFSDVFDACMQGPDQDRDDRQQKCENDYADCLKRVGN